MQSTNVKSAAVERAATEPTKCQGGRSGGGETNSRLAVLRKSLDDDADLRHYFPECGNDDPYVSYAPWPELQGCLGILFTSRSGSTFLSRELEKRYTFGLIRESFNFPVLRSRSRSSQLKTPAAAMRYSVKQLQEAGWFGFKAGTPGLIVAERCGFIEYYLPLTRLILLIRQDLVAQAVSLAKAKASSIYHSGQRARKTELPVEYSFEKIKRAIQVIGKGVKRIDDYAQRSGRPCMRAYYEDFAKGDFHTIDEICREFGVPKRMQPPKREVQKIEKIGDRINDEWCARFRGEMDVETRRLVDEYRIFLQR